MTIFVASIAILTLINSVVLLVVMRHFGVIAIETTIGHNNDGLRVGTRLPNLVGSDSDDAPLDIRPAIGKWVVIAAHPTCALCVQLLKDLRASPVRVGAIVVTDGNGDDCRLLEDVGPPGQYVADKMAFARLQVEVTPFVYVVNNGRVASKGLASSSKRVAQLISQAADV